VQNGLTIILNTVISEENMNNIAQSDPSGLFQNLGALCPQNYVARVVLTAQQDCQA
jgi:sulfur transfer protein SufE